MFFIPLYKASSTLYYLSSSMPFPLSSTLYSHSISLPFPCHQHYTILNSSLSFLSSTLYYHSNSLPFRCHQHYSTHSNLFNLFTMRTFSIIDILLKIKPYILEEFKTGGKRWLKIFIITKDSRIVEEFKQMTTDVGILTWILLYHF